ncbi:MAG: calcium/sodium antiporter [Bacteroidota bacterium]
MLFDLLIFLAGLAVLYLGAEWLVKGAALLALQYGIRPIVVGLTVVALGTSMPEFILNFIAAFSGEDSLALGNIVGSNICNIALILGTSAVVLPLAVKPGTLRKEYPIMMAVMVLFYVLALDGLISQTDGVILVAGLLAFMAFVVIDSRRQTRLEEEAAANAPAPPAAQGAATESAGGGRDAQEAPAELPRWKKIGLLAGGMAFLGGGAQLMVYAAVNVAESLGIDPIIVGLTVLAIGTSLPELAASVVSAMKQEADLSLGNVLGSNLLNVLFVVGMLSLFRPLAVDSESIAIHFPVMLAFAAILLPVAWTGYQISRVEGGVLLAGFTGYLVYLVLPYM